MTEIQIALIIISLVIVSTALYFCYRTIRLIKNLQTPISLLAVSIILIIIRRILTIILSVYQHDWLQFFSDYIIPFTVSGLLSLFIFMLYRILKKLLGIDNKL